MSKAATIMRDIVSVYHPRFRKSKDLRSYGMDCPELFNVERLVEESFAAVGKYKFIDAAHADFSDGTDSKTASIRERARVEGSVSFAGEIGNVVTAGGSHKSGALRCVVYNPHKPQGELKYYFLPKDMWENHIVLHPTTGIGKIVYSYNSVKDEIVRFAGFQCKDFRELARAS